MKKTMRFLLAAVALVFGMTSCDGSGMFVEQPVTVKALDPAKAYLKWDGTQKKLVAAEIPATATPVESKTSDVDWLAGTYVVGSNVTINGTITLNGDVNLIIVDNAKLTANQIVGNSKNLSIYGQFNQPSSLPGQLVVNNPDDDAITSIKTLEVHGAKVTATSYGSNFGGFYDISEFNVYGGLVDAYNAGWKGFGIYLKENGSMNIYGGVVNAEGKGDSSLFGCGILCDNSDKKATVTVYGGKLWSGSAKKAALNSNITLEKGEGFTGQIYTKDDESYWSVYNGTATPTTKYVKVE